MPHNQQTISKMKVIDNIKVFFDANNKCVVIELTGFVNAEQIKVCGNAAIDLLKEKHSKAILVNQLKSVEPDFERRDWVIDNWFGNAVAAGMERLALVVSDSFYAAANPKTFKNGKLNISYFNNVDSANKWTKII